MTEAEVKVEKKDGYKKTKLGLIPIDWKLIKLSDVISLESGQHLSPDEYNNDGEGVPYFTGPTDFCNSIDKVTKWSEEASKYAESGDILITVKGSGVGSLFISDLNKIAIGRQLMAIKPQKMDRGFLYNFLKQRSQVFEILASGNMIPGLSRKDILSFKTPYPPKEEQTKIAEIFSVWDEAISKTEKLIKAKKRYKKGLMQRLLSGKVRFPKFEGEDWVEVKFGEVFDRVTEKNEDETVKNVLTISAQDGLVSQTDYYNKSVASKDLSNYTIVRKGDFAYNKSYSEGYPLGAIKRLDDYEKGVLSPLYICFKLTSDKVDSDFITHFFEYGGLDHGIYKIAREGARNHGLLNVSVKDFFEIDLTLPQYDEQKKIATILNEATKEIQLLEAQLEMYQQQKKGLMQQLLTGKVRVK